MLYKYEITQNNKLETNDLSVFEDYNDISQWALEGLSWANAKGIVTGNTSTTLTPKANANRAVVATMFCRYLGV